MQFGGPTRRRRSASPNAPRWSELHSSSLIEGRPSTYEGLTSKWFSLVLIGRLTLGFPSDPRNPTWNRIGNYGPILFFNPCAAYWHRNSTANVTRRIFLAGSCSTRERKAPLFVSFMRFMPR
jgi:hypothetical protein